MASNRCPACGKHFQTLDDEVGTHDCPHCGWEPGEEMDFVEEENDSWLWEKEAETAEAMNEELERERKEEEGETLPWDFP